MEISDQYRLKQVIISMGQIKIRCQLIGCNGKKQRTCAIPEETKSRYDHDGPLRLTELERHSTK